MAAKGETQLGGISVPRKDKRRFVKIISDTLSKAKQEVHYPRKDQPFDLFYINGSGRGVAVVCNASAAYSFSKRDNFRRALREKLQRLPSEIDELCLVDEDLPVDLVEIAVEFEKVEAWDYPSFLNHIQNQVPAPATSIARVSRIIHREGFVPIVSRVQEDNAIHLRFAALSGDVIGVCCRDGRLLPERFSGAWLDDPLFRKRRISELIVVDFDLPQEIQTRISGQTGVFSVPYLELGYWLQRYKTADRPEPRTVGTRGTGTGSRTAANSTDVVLAAEALSVLIDQRLNALRKEKPNSDEAIATRDRSIADCEALKEKVDKLQDAVAKFRRGRVKEATVQKRAMSFGDGIKDWWEKNHLVTLDRSWEMGLFLSGVAVCSLIGVNPGVAAAASVAVVLKKKSAMAAIKKAASSGS